MELSLPEQLDEMKRFMEKVELKETIFRSDHASNRLVLKGVLGKDKGRFLEQINQAIEDPLGNTRNIYGGY